MLNNPMMFQRQVYCPNNVNPCYMQQQQQQQHQLYHQQQHFHQMKQQQQHQQQHQMMYYHHYNHPSNAYVQHNIKYHQQPNFYNRPPQLSSPYYLNYNNNSSNNMFWNTKQNNYQYQQYKYPYDQAQRQFSVYPININNNSNPTNNTNNNNNKQSNLCQSNKNLNNQSPTSQNNIIGKSMPKLPLSNSNSDHNKSPKQVNNRKNIESNQKSTQCISSLNKLSPHPKSPPIKKELADKQIMTDFILKQIEDTTVIKIGDKYDYNRELKTDQYLNNDDKRQSYKNNNKELDCEKPQLKSIYNLSNSINSSGSLVFNDLETSSEFFRQEENDSTTIVNHIEIKLDNSIIDNVKSQHHIQSGPYIPPAPPLPTSKSQHFRPISNTIGFNSTMEELKCNNLFLAQQRKVEEYENLHEEERKNNICNVNTEINMRLRREFKQNNNLQGERSNTRYRCLNAAKHMNKNDYNSSSSTSCSDNKDYIEPLKSKPKTKPKTKEDFVNNKSGRLKFKINDQLMDSSLGKIKFLGVYKADPQNYFRNMCKNKAYDKDMYSMKYASLNEDEIVNKEEEIAYLKESSTSSSKNEKYYKLVRGENGIMTLKEL